MQRLFKIQQELNAGKNQFNGYGKYKYRTCEGIIENAKPLLRSTNLVLTMNDDVKEIGGRVYLVATATLWDAGSGKELVSTSGYSRDEPYNGMSAGQGTGASSSYARKYALCGLFGIDGSEDHDELDKRPREQAQPCTAAEAGAQSSVASPVDEIKAVKSRVEFEVVQRKYIKRINEAEIKTAMMEVAKRFPKVK